MKGKLLTINELRNMQNKEVFLECVGEEWNVIAKKLYMHTYIVKGEKLIRTNSNISFFIDSLNDNKYECNVYEWIDDSKILTGDQIRKLPHGTKIRFNYRRRPETLDGIINQSLQMIGGYSNDIDNCLIYFYSLDSDNVEAYVTELPKQETPIQEVKEESEMANMESEFKINPNAIYSVTYKTLSDTKSRMGFEGCKLHNLEGKIQTFCPSGIVAVETEIGLQIINTRQIVQMLIIKD